MEDGATSKKFVMDNDDDSFFDLTLDEVKRRAKDLRREAKILEEGQEFVTKGYKASKEEAAKLDRLNRFKKSILRIVFPDRLILQGVFLSGAKVDEVKAFIARYLDNPSAEFDLFITPPKTILDPKSTST